MPRDGSYFAPAWALVHALLTSTAEFTHCLCSNLMVVYQLVLRPDAQCCWGKTYANAAQYTLLHDYRQVEAVPSNIYHVHSDLAQAAGYWHAGSCGADGSQAHAFTVPVGQGKTSPTLICEYHATFRLYVGGRRC